MRRYGNHEHVEEVRGREDAEELARHLRRLDRDPVVVVSVADGAPAPAIDVTGLEELVRDAASLVVLPAHASAWLARELGDRSLSVHSGWARVYPATAAWRERPELAPLFPPRRQDPRRSLEAIAEAVFAAAFRERREPRRRGAPAGTRVSAVVDGFLTPAQVLVRVEPGSRQALLRTRRLVPGLPAPRLLVPGQCLRGVLDGGGGILPEFVPDPPAGDVHEAALAFVGSGVVTCARVASVTSGSARVLLHPSVEVRVEAAPGEDLAAELEEGDVVAVEVVVVDNELVAALSADAPGPAMAILPGGPPWLLPEEAERPLGAATDATASLGLAEAPARASGPEETEASDGLEDLARELDVARARIRELRRELQRARRLALPRVFADPEEQFRFEAWLSYLVHVDEASRGAYPWREDYRLGPRFLDSVDRLVGAGAIRRERIVRVCAEVVCGIARHLPSRGVKEWLVSPHGPPLVREDGALCWRVRLENETSSARRLRYWRLRTGAVELDSVGVHDEGI